MGEAHQNSFEEAMKLCRMNTDATWEEAWRISSLWDFFPYLTRIATPLQQEEFDLLYAVAEDVEHLYLFSSGLSEVEEVVNFFVSIDMLNKKIDLEDFQETLKRDSRKLSENGKISMECFRVLIKTLTEQRLNLINNTIMLINDGESPRITVEEYIEDSPSTIYGDRVERSKYTF